MLKAFSVLKARYLSFCLDFLVMFENGLIRKIGLISKFITSYLRINSLKFCSFFLLYTKFRTIKISMHIIFKALSSMKITLVFLEVKRPTLKSMARVYPNLYREYQNSYDLKSLYCKIQQGCV